MTCSAAEPIKLARARRQVFLAIFIAVAIALHTIETLLPTPVPWLRIGLANIMTLAALYLYDSRAAWTVSLTRLGLASLLLGRLFSPGFWLASAGVIVATSAMIVVYRIAGRRLSPIGVSAIGAAGHALGQMFVAQLLIIQHAAIWQIFPFFLFFTILAGMLTGWLATGLIEQLKQHPAFQSVAESNNCLTE
jgi:heptaprenyl diphosphate synthase